MAVSEAKYQRMFEEAQADAVRFRQERDQARADLQVVANAQAEDKAVIARLMRRVDDLLEANNRELGRRRALDDENSQLLAEQKLVRAECIRQRNRAEKLAEYIEGFRQEGDGTIPADVAAAMEATFPGAPAAAINLEERVAEWIRTRIGEANSHRRERAMRCLEEAVELAQAEGIGIDLVRKQVDHVFARPPGEPEQEVAGVAVCLLAWCAATGVRLFDLAEREVGRIERKPVDQIRGSVARKADADLVLCVPEGSDAV